MKSEKKDPSKAGRILYIDRLRGLAVVGMFVAHSAYAYLSRIIPYEGYFRANMELAGMVAPVFCFLAGISLVILSAKVWKKTAPNEDSLSQKKAQKKLKKRIMFRGLQILLLGYGLRLTFWVLGHFYSPWIRLFKVDILQCIGLALMVFPLIAWPPNGKSFWRINWPAGFVTLGMALSTALFFHLPLEGNLPEGIRAYMDVSCRLALFPFFPYGMWIVLGLFVGSIVPLELKKGKTEALVVGGLLLTAFFLFYLGKYLDTLTQTYPLYQLWGNKRPPKGLFHGFLIKIAYLMGIFAAARVSALLLDRLPFQFMSLFGRTSLFAYCVHLIIIYHVTYNWVTIPSPPSIHLFYSALLTLFMWGLCWIWFHTSPLAYIKRLLSSRPFAADKVG